jgi:hypothetical protein
MDKQVKLCSICSQPITEQLNGWTDGHNAQPVNDGRCCQDCNDSVVIPIRILVSIKGESR